MWGWRSAAGALMLGVVASAAWAHGPVVEVEDSWFSSEADGTPRITRAEVGERVWWFVRARNRGDAPAPAITVRLMRDGRRIAVLKFKDRDRLGAGERREKGKRLPTRELRESGRLCYAVELREPRRHAHLEGDLSRRLCIEIAGEAPPRMSEEEPEPSLPSAGEIFARQMLDVARRLAEEATGIPITPEVARRIRPVPEIYGLPGVWRVLDGNLLGATSLYFQLANDSRQRLRGTLTLWEVERGSIPSSRTRIELAPGEARWLTLEETLVGWGRCFEVRWKDDDGEPSWQVLRNDRGESVFCIGRPTIAVEAWLERIYVYNNGDDGPVDMSMEYYLCWLARGHRHQRDRCDPVRFRMVVEDESGYRIRQRPSRNDVSPGGELRLQAYFVDRDELSSDETGSFVRVLGYDWFFRAIRDGIQRPTILGTTRGDLRIDLTFRLALEVDPSSVEITARR